MRNSSLRLIVWVYKSDLEIIFPWLLKPLFHCLLPSNVADGKSHASIGELSSFCEILGLAHCSHIPDFPDDISWHGSLL